MICERLKWCAHITTTKPVLSIYCVHRSLLPHVCTNTHIIVPCWSCHNHLWTLKCDKIITFYSTNVDVKFHSDSPWVSDFPPGGFQRCPERLQNSAVCPESKNSRFTEAQFKERKVWERTHNDSWVISCHGDVVCARGRDQTHGQHKQRQSQQGHVHPQGRLPAAQVLNCSERSSHARPTQCAPARSFLRLLLNEQNFKPRHYSFLLSNYKGHVNI